MRKRNPFKKSTLKVTLLLGARFMPHSLTSTHLRRPTNSLSVIGQLSPCARAVSLAVEWHFVPQWGVSGVPRWDVLLSALPRCAQALALAQTSFTLQHSLQSPDRLTDSLSFSPNPPSCRRTAELLKKSGATPSGLTVVLKMRTDFYRRDLSVCRTKPTGESTMV